MNIEETTIVEDVKEEEEKKRSDKLVPASEVEGAICEEVKPGEAEKLEEMANEMIEICKAEGGAGLAAPQVGIRKRMFIWSQNGRDYEIVFNPTFYKLDGGKRYTKEGCLTYPEEIYQMRRWKNVGVIYFVWNGEDFIKRTNKFKRVPAVIFQHEVSHLLGRTIKMDGTFLYKKEKETEVDVKKTKGGDK